MSYHQSTTMYVVVCILKKSLKSPWCSVGLLEKCLYFLLSLYWNRQYRTPFFCRSHGYDIKTRAFLLWVVTLIPPIFALKLFILHIQMIGLSGWKIHDPRIRGFTDAKFLPHLIELNLFTWLFTVSFRNIYLSKFHFFPWKFHEIFREIDFTENSWIFRLISTVRS